MKKIGINNSLYYFFFLSISVATSSKWLTGYRKISPASSPHSRLVVIIHFSSPSHSMLGIRVLVHFSSCTSYLKSEVTISSSLTDTFPSYQKDSTENYTSKSQLQQQAEQAGSSLRHLTAVFSVSGKRKSGCACPPVLFHQCNFWLNSA